MIKIGSKINVVCFFHTYQGEVIGESEEGKKPVKSKFFKDLLNDIHGGITGYYIEDTEVVN